jgi:hypothetical protein
LRFGGTGTSIVLGNTYGGCGGTVGIAEGEAVDEEGDVSTTGTSTVGLGLDEVLGEGLSANPMGSVTRKAKRKTRRKIHLPFPRFITLDPFRTYLNRQRNQRHSYA